jgi:hypothetical protein
LVIKNSIENGILRKSFEQEIIQLFNRLGPNVINKKIYINNKYLLTKI